MLKPLIIAFALLTVSSMALAEEGAEHGDEHGEKKPPPKPFKGSPVEAVLALPVVQKWKQSMARGKSHLMAWGESINEVDGNKCWSIAVGENRFDGVHPWRRFCVPQSGGDILVESVVTEPGATVNYMPYEKWVGDCKPTDTFQGNC